MNHTFCIRYSFLNIFYGYGENEKGESQRDIIFMQYVDFVKEIALAK
jgi:hypothetical protein